MVRTVISSEAPTRRPEGGPTSKATRRLLACGMVAGPVYFAVGLGQAFTREGFDVTRHALSLLENGQLGWIQIGNFLASGLLAVACAAGMRRALGRGPGGTWGPRLVAAYGAGLACAGVFHADPADGFPPGTPAGQGQVGWHGVLHLASFGAGFLCLIAACFVVARGLAALGRRRAAATSRAGGAVVLAGVAASFATAGSGAAVAAVYVAVAAAWAWLAWVAARLATMGRAS
jgi:Protein of unknown function (DUF998)